jgi:hypothetical protein
MLRRTKEYYLGMHGPLHRVSLLLAKRTGGDNGGYDIQRAE